MAVAARRPLLQRTAAVRPSARAAPPNPAVSAAVVGDLSSADEAAARCERSHGFGRHQGCDACVAGPLASGPSNDIEYLPSDIVSSLQALLSMQAFVILQNGLFS